MLLYQCWTAVCIPGKLTNEPKWDYPCTVNAQYTQENAHWKVEGIFELGGKQPLWGQECGWCHNTTGLHGILWWAISKYDEAISILRAGLEVTPQLRFYFFVSIGIQHPLTVSSTSHMPRSKKPTRNLLRSMQSTRNSSTSYGSTLGYWKHKTRPLLIQWQ